MQIIYNQKLKGYEVKYGKSIVACHKERVVALINAIKRINARLMCANSPLAIKE